MKNPMRWMAFVIVLAASSAAFGQTSDPDTTAPPAPAQSETTVTNTKTTTTTSSVESWPETQRTAAGALTEKYGQPDVATDQTLTWNDKDPWTRVTVRRTGVKDTFPVNHVSYIDQTISYAVPNDRTNEIENFDPSLSVDKDAQTITSRSDSEAGNILALNLANEIARGKLDANQARDMMRKKWDEHMAGKSSPYTDHLMFSPGKGPVEEEEPVEPGTP